MLVYTYCIAEAFLFVMLSAAYLKKDEKLWGMGAVLAGILAALSMNIAFPTLDKLTTYYSFNDMTGVVFNVAMMIIAITFFFLDSYQNYGSPLLFFKSFKLKQKNMD